MFIKQLSVSIENREERLGQVTEVLKKENINILSLNMANTTGYGTLRMIVSDPKRARNGLKERGFSTMLTDVLAVKLEGHVGEPHRIIHTLYGQGLDIEYMHALTSANRRTMIVKASDGETATKTITDGGLVLYSSGKMCWQADIQKGPGF